MDKYLFSLHRRVEGKWEKMLMFWLILLINQISCLYFSILQHFCDESISKCVLLLNSPGFKTHFLTIFSCLYTQWFILLNFIFPYFLSFCSFYYNFWVKNIFTVRWTFLISIIYVSFLVLWVLRQFSVMCSMHIWYFRHDFYLQIHVQCIHQIYLGPGWQVLRQSNWRIQKNICFRKYVERLLTFSALH